MRPPGQVRERRPMLAAAPQLPTPTPAAADGSLDRARIAALEQALVDELVTFHDVAGAWFLLCDEAVDASERARLEQLYPRLRSAWETPRGGIVTAYFCER